jgi:hypothetical protein
VVKLGQKPPRHLFRCRRKEADMQDFVCLGSTAPYSQNCCP